MTKPTIATVDAKVDSFISSAEKSIQKLTDTMAELNTVHTQINHLSEKITGTEVDVKEQGIKLEKLGLQMATNSVQTDEYKSMKKWIAALLLSLIASGVWYVVEDASKTKHTNAIYQAQVKAMSDIAKTLKDNISKGK